MIAALVEPVVAMWGQALEKGRCCELGVNLPSSHQTDCVYGGIVCVNSYIKNSTCLKQNKHGKQAKRAGHLARSFCLSRCLNRWLRARHGKAWALGLGALLGAGQYAAVHLTLDVVPAGGEPKWRAC